ncbi:MAG: PilN domain-containing protein [bacterium]
MSLHINLLPEARVIKIKNQQTKRLTLVICSLIISGVAGSLIILLLLLGARTLQFNANAKKIADQKVAISSKASVEQEVAWFNSALSASNAVSEKRILISQLFERLTEALPNDVKLSSVGIDPDYKVKASVSAKDFNTVALFGDALRSYNVSGAPNRFINGLDKKPVFTDIVIDSVSNKKGDSKSTADGKVFEVTFMVDKDLVNKFHEDSKTSVKAGQ